ncbi:PREDICTED: uncharacterized protein LOC108364574 [Rhagoletis zephyria]|uniref:uncharacterized protein LOC108364574 n=1 Tax=Rhagoletis zephyria TaxID=28612 RepID=UPI00081172AA|nr:PREDICTED: uncharacterized protein LOC108364574 [Rhagoletis zephyria]
MMEPAVLQEQPQQMNDYKQKVNKMQKLLPSLEQYIANVTSQNENAEELEKLKLLRELLLQQEVVGDRLTLGELDRYEVMLKGVANTPLLTSASTLVSNACGDEDTTSNVSASKTALEANIDLPKNGDIDKNFNSNEVEGKESEGVVNGLTLPNECEKSEETCNEGNGSRNKESESLGKENKSSDKERENSDIGQTSKEITGSIKDQEENVLQSCDETPGEQDLVDDVSDSKKLDENSQICEKKNEVTNSNKTARKQELKEQNYKDDQQNNDKSTDTTTTEALDHFEAPEDIEEIEYEDVELIKIPESTAEDEMILPDSADEAEFSAHKSDDEVEEAEEEEETEEEQIGENQVEEEEETEEEQVEEEDEENINACVHSENVIDKAEIIKNNQDMNETAVSDKNETAQEQIEVIQGSDSNKRDSEHTKDVNEKVNEDTDDDEAQVEEATIEEISEAPTGSNEESCALPAEFDVEIDSQSDAAVGVGDVLQTDDPLGQADVTNEADNSQETSNETAAIRTTEHQILQQPTDVAAETVSNEDPNVDDDDDVEIIESRNSPICLDTDEENDKEFGPKSAANNSLLREVQSTQSLCKRQHTRVPNRRDQQEMTIKTAKSVTETIELLDSSDEDGANCSNNPPRGRKSRTTLRPTLTRTLVKMPTQQVRMGKKRTLLPAAPAQKPIKISKVMSGGAVPEAYRAFLSETSSPPRASAVKLPRSVSLFPPTNFTPTPQSNFLNAVNLLPASATSGDNPLAFSAMLSNKNIIIPNAFYANRRTTAKDKEKDNQKERMEEPAAHEVSPSASSKSVPKSTQVLVTQQQERVYREWLDGFIDNFANPQQIASHSCLVLMQSALKYKVFARIKDLRTSLNTKAYTSNCTADGQLTRELRNAFYTDDCRLSMEGLRFCAGACTQIGIHVTLMTDARTGRITTRTSSYDELMAKYVNGGGVMSDDKRKRHKGDEEYTPAKYYEKKVEESLPSRGERRKSLRQHRSRCYDETFLYEPEEAEDDEPPPVEKEASTNKRRQEDQMMALVQRKAEEKRLEAKRQRQQQVKSFESAYLEMFANSLQAKNLKGSTAAAKRFNESSSKSRSSNSTDSTNNQIVIDDDDEDSLVDGEPRSHRIYKVVPTRLLAAEISDSSSDDEPRPKRGRPRKQDLSNLKPQKKAAEPELITCDSTSNDSVCDVNDMPAPDSKAPKNINPNWHAANGDWCIICNKRKPRVVSHYVNEHPACEVYNSRIPKTALAQLRKQGGQVCEKSHPYSHAQDHYTANCVFCNKTCCFQINYWYRHYAIHTGEYAFRCSGCNIRKTTVTLMKNHINQPCPRRGRLIQDYAYDLRVNKIKMHVCTLCNYMQLHRRNVLKHLRTQHGLKQIKAKNIESVILLRMPETEEANSTQEINEFMDLSSGGDENSSQMAMTFNYDNFDEAGAVNMWDDGDPTDDLSYMICGMLDVQMRDDGE